MIKSGNTDKMSFFSEMCEYQITAREFFSTVLLDSLNRNFGYHDVLISYFDTEGNFLSWTNSSGALLDCEGHPYRKFMKNDIIRYQIFLDAVRDKLTYFNVTPRLYKATDAIDKSGYENSSYVKFLEENFHKHYSVTLAFGINAYIQTTFFKSKEDGDFTDGEIADLEEVYVYVANSYKNFKKYEQAKIVANIQSEIIDSGENAFLVTDDFNHVMSYNKVAQQYLADILGDAMVAHMESSTPCSWLPFLLSDEEGSSDESRVQMRVIRNYIFKIYTYDQTYSNGIMDRYHWITISEKKEGELPASAGTKSVTEVSKLTRAEQKVAELICQGLTYKAIADNLIVSYHTVKKHVQNIYSKCGVNSRYELYKWMEDEALSE